LRIARLIISLALTAFSFASLAQSQDLMGFDRSSFGSVVLSRTQAAGTDVQLEMSIGSYENEPISNYMGTIFADIGRSVGRLDVLTDKGLFPCTAFIVSKRHILTNYHCSLGLLDNEQVGATSIEATQFVAGYTQTGVDEGTKKYTVIPNPVEFSAELDYAVLEVIGNPSQEYGQLKLASLVPNDRAPFWVIGHPQGKGQHISREKCRASTPAVSRNKLLHTCDTLPGNSGSPVIDAGLQIVVGLHYAGISNDSVNAAILMSKILDNSKVLAAYKAPSALSTTDVEPLQTAEITPCDALYSAAAEAKACFAYEAYFKSCRNHSLAPIADGYIKEFCQVEETVKVDEAPKTTVVKKTCSIETPKLCTGWELCEKSLTLKSGKAGWRKDNASYLTEAKDRGFTCRMAEAVAQAQGLPSCPTDQSKRFHNCFGAWENEYGEKYYGWFKDGKKNGWGIYDHIYGNYYVGEFKDDERNGQGTYYWATGGQLIGGWRNGKENGQITYTTIDGDKTVGEYKDGKRNGLFTYTHRDGTVSKNLYKDDKLLEPNLAIKTTVETSDPLEAAMQEVISDKSLIENIQAELNRIGCNAGTPDGVVGPASRSAVERFNIANKSGFRSEGFFSSSILEDLKTLPINSCLPVAEAKYKGACEVAFPEFCADDKLCKYSTIKMTDRVWTQNLRFKSWVKEAKNRGLSCGVTGANKVTPNSTASSVAIDLTTNMFVGNIYSCKFDSKNTRGWVPTTLVLNTVVGTIRFNGETATVGKNKTSPVIWSKQILTNGGQRIDTVYQLNIRYNLSATIKAKMRNYSNEYIKIGKCTRSSSSKF